MLPSANRFTVVLDANVLFPQMKRDLLLEFYKADLYRARWSEQIQQEWLRSAKGKYPDKSDSLDRVDKLMREHFEEAWIDNYESFIDAVDLPDKGDRHVVATAIRCQAQYIVTDNVKHFPADELAKFDLEAGTADKFLVGTFEHYPRAALAVLRDHRRNLRANPTAPEYVMQLIVKGMPLLAARLKEHQDAGL